MANRKVLTTCPGCGKERSAFLSNLKQAGHSYCGSCSSLERHNRGKNYIGKIYGRLTIISDAEPIYDNKHRRQAMVNCVCSCGKEITIRRNQVFRGHTKSCGCLHLEMCTARIQEINKEKSSGLSKEEQEEIRLSRGGKEILDWAHKIRSTGKCVICGSSQNLAAHHLESYRDNPELRYDIKNGVCLCAQCHVEYHTQFLGNYRVLATVATFDKFMRMKNGEIG